MNADVLQKRAQLDETLGTISDRITRTFAVLERVGNSVVDGTVRSVIISGATGCGKTHTLERILAEAQSQERIRWHTIRGTISGIALYQELHEYRHQRSVLMLDDCDAIFSDLEAVNLLKAALDTRRVRTVHWNKESRVLMDAGIERSFDFDGAVVFITNTDFTRAIEENRKMTPHYQALLSRCMYLDVGIHNRREILVRIGQVVFSREFLEEHQITRRDAETMLKWITTHLSSIRVLSIRTMVSLAQLMRSSGSDWENMAEAMLLTRR
jgi:hypothetical protein